MLVRSPRACIDGDRVDVFGDRQALAGQCSFRHAQRGRLDDPRVSRHGVAFFDDQDVAGDHVGGWNRRQHTIANDVRMRRRHLLERSDGGLGSLFLQVAHHGVQQHDGADSDRFVRQRRVTLVQPEDEGNGGGDQEQDDQQVGELREELSPRRNRAFGREAIRTIAFESRSGLAARQAACSVSRVRSDDLFHALLVLGRHVVPLLSSQAGNLRHFKMK